MKWSEISQTDKFKALKPDDQERSRNLYFEEEVKPQYPENMLAQVRKDFDEDTAPKKSRGLKDIALETVSIIADTPRRAKEAIKEYGQSANSAAKSLIAGTGEMIERPVAAGVNAITGKRTMTGEAFTGLGKRADEEMPKGNLIANLAGEATTYAAPMKAAGKLAEGAKFVERGVKAATTGAALAMASEPVTDPNSNFAEAKLKQATKGGIYSLAAHGAAEGLSMAGDLTKRVAFGIQSEGASKIWDRAKSLGFSIRPEQSRADSARVSQSGLSDTDKLRNASVGVRETSSILGNPVKPYISRGKFEGGLTPEWFDETAAKIKAQHPNINEEHPQYERLLAEADPRYAALNDLKKFTDKEGSVDLEELGKAIKGNKDHPLAELGHLGETLGIRSISKPSLAGNRWSGSGDEAFAPTRANAWRWGLQQAKIGKPTRAIHEDYMKLGGGYRAENVSPYAMGGNLIANDPKERSR